MKIKEVNVFPVREWRTMLFVQVVADDGTYGLGEAGLTSREGAVGGMIRDLTPYLIGEDPFRIEHLWQTMWRSGFHPSGQVLSSAIAAIDMALYDIKGKALGVPVYELLGGRARDKVHSYCHIKGDTTDELLVDASARVAEGWTCLRFEPTNGTSGVFDEPRAIARAIDEYRLLREELGDDIEIAFDAHTKFSPPAAARFCRAVEPFRPYFIEDPLRSEFPDGYRHLRGQTAVPLAAGEQFGTKWMFRPLVEENLIDYARIDLAIAGGLTEARKIGAMCEAHMIDLAVHNPIGPVSTAACLHLNLASSNVLVQELPKRPGESLPALFSTDQTWEWGYLSCKGRPGLGVEFHPEALERYPFLAESLPTLKRPDGSFTNW